VQRLNAHKKTKNSTVIQISTHDNLISSYSSALKKLNNQSMNIYLSISLSLSHCVMMINMKKSIH